MYASALMAFLHHLAAFSLVGALAAEVVLFKPPLTVVQARRLQRTDQVFGAAAGVLLVVGLLRVVYFEKGVDYYFSNGFFLAKFTLFIVAGLISIYPTVLFISWNKALKEGQVPAMTAAGSEAYPHVHDVGADSHPGDSAVCAVHGAWDRPVEIAAARISLASRRFTLGGWPRPASAPTTPRRAAARWPRRRTPP